MDEISLPLVDGAQVHFVKELIGESFKIVDNPIVDGGCGCGVSFNLNLPSSDIPADAFVATSSPSGQTPPTDPSPQGKGNKHT